MRRLLPTLLLAAGIGAAGPALAAGPACPSTDLDAFLKAFTADVAVQRAFTDQPLRNTYVDAMAEPEPREVTEMLSEPVLRFRVIPDPREQAAQGLQARWTKRGDRQAELTLQQMSDNDYQLTYVFRRDNCWRLVSRSDDSL